MDNFVIGTIQENIKTLSNEIQVLNSNTPSKLADLSDVSTVTPTDGDTLVYDATYNIFKPQAQSGGSGGSSITELDDIPNVTITTPLDDQVLKYSGGNWINANVIDNDTDNLEDLTDTLLTSPFSNDEVLKYFNGKWVNGNIPIEKLSNVLISGLQNGNTLIYNSGEWENGNIGAGSGTETIALGTDAGAGQTTQGDYAVAIGVWAGNSGQSRSAIAIGLNAGQTTQGISAVAIGEGAGNNGQGSNSVAIGYYAGSGGQGSNSVAIGYQANNSADEFDNTVVINGSGTPLNPEGEGSTYIKPIRSSTTSQVLYYDDGTGEVTRGAPPTGSGGGGSLSGLTDTAILDPQDNQVLKYSDGKWKNLDEGGAFNSLPYGSFALKEDSAEQTFSVDAATATKYDYVILSNKMILYDSNSVVITNNVNETTLTTPMQYFGVQTTTDYILRWAGILNGTSAAWVTIILEDSLENEVQKSVSFVIQRSPGTPEGFATFQIMARLEVGKKYTIKIQSQVVNSTSEDYGTIDRSPWQFNLQIYAVGSGN